MKYWNKAKQRRQNWTIITVRVWHADAKLWCQRHPSKSKFYANPYSNIWYFENAQDAVVFKLAWGHNG